MVLLLYLFIIIIIDQLVFMVSLSTWAVLVVSIADNSGTSDKVHS